ncbi:unnamed protein product [Bursaphelenchus xylophilus]|uniref:(pine wood nematode) hypothetical protein n=1 Tax=Bursaphelenchus xylophilus TaxID=6326 RepID=A0A1I7SEU7_BURXY|nr:unnamed protein product [Bursaphelenchus xylophilus]CAG9113209.1 unnamed protein product [Bursaphelenchus xylophilus]
MGNIEGKESKPAADKAQMTQPVGANDRQYMLYTLVDMHGGGELIPWMRYALNSGDHSLIDGYMETKVCDMTYNGGKGRLESVAELVKRRNKERNERLGAFSRKKGKGKSGPNILDDFNQENNQGDLKKALKLLDGGKGGKGDAKYREIVWKLDSRGSMGESLLGCCLMQGTAVHNQLAIKLLEQFPKLVNDIFISEDYYGLSPLHQAIVNEDPFMVSYLLQKGAEINQRCYGAFFSPDDQISSRTDSLEHEYVEVNFDDTNYKGKMYFGEYPLAFAACTNQVDCYRILRAHRADPNAQDTNGNTVLHMTVIHENLDMFRLVYETGGKLQIMNKQNLTPLTLAAKLAKKTMFEQILQLESNVIWHYGDAASTAFPLAKIDTINQETGELNEDSALSLIVYGDSKEHLDLLDGLLEDLLQAKWQAYGRRSWQKSLSAFVVYYLFYFVAFMTRPFSLNTSITTDFWIEDGQVDNRSHSTLIHLTELNDIYEKETHNPMSTFLYKYWASKPSCFLLMYSRQGYQGYVRAFCETTIVLLVLIQIVIEIIEIRSVGKKRYWQVLKAFPAKIMYKISLIITILVVPVRFSCGLDTTFNAMLIAENTMILVAVILTTIHFLFYCRAIKFVGPFVLMVYTIITRDMFRFFMIYFIFLMGFSQGFYLIFLTCERSYRTHLIEVENKTFDEARRIAEDKNIMSMPIESMLRLFITTIGEFTVFYRELNSCMARDMAVLGKALFFIFEMFVSLMQFNLLIAMMTRTYELIYRTQKEWKRQWAQVILMLELSLTPKDRLMALLKYSRPIGTDKRRRAFVVNRKIDPLNESERILKERQESEKRKEKKLLLKRRLKGFKDVKTGLRPMTSYLTAPSPMPPRR